MDAKVLAQALTAVEYWLAEQRELLGIPCLSVSVSHKGCVVYSNTLGESPTKRPLYRIASISKVFTAITVLQLVEEGQLHLNDRVGDYCEWTKSAKDKRTSKLTIRQLLTHTTGMTRDGGIFWNTDDFPDAKMLRRIVAENRLIFAPPARFKYSNLAFGLLGQVIESVTGEPYETIVQKRILRPLKLTRTHIDVKPNGMKGLVPGYGRAAPGKKRPRIPNIPTKALAPATGFASDAEDVARFFNALCRPQDGLLSEAGLRSIKRTQQSVSESEKRTFALFAYPKPQLRLSHSGGFMGYITVAACDPKRDIGISIFTNAIGAPAGPLMTGFLKLIWRFEKEAGARGDASALGGVYENRWSKDVLAPVDGRLLWLGTSIQDPAEWAMTLSPEKDGYRVTKASPFDRPGEHFVFRKEGGKLVAQSAGWRTTRVSKLRPVRLKNA